MSNAKKIITACDVKSSNFKAQDSGYTTRKLEMKSPNANYNMNLGNMSLGNTPYGKNMNATEFKESLSLANQIGKTMFANEVFDNKAKCESFLERHNAPVSIDISGLKESISGFKISNMESFLVEAKSEAQTTANNDSLYVKFLNETIYGDIAMDLEPYMKLVNVNEDLKRMEGKGFGSLKIPKIMVGIASVLGEGGEVVLFGDKTEHIDITCNVKAIGTTITWELQRRGLGGVLKLMMSFASNGLQRKIIADIVDTLAVGAGLSQTVTGAGSTISYNDIVDARAKVNTAKYDGIPYGFKTNKLVIDELQFASLQKSDDYKQHVFRATILPSEKTGTLNRMVQFFGDLEIVTTNMLNTALAKGFVLDSVYAGLFVKESDYITFEYDMPNTFGVKQLILGMSYGMAVLFDKAICKFA